MRRFAHTPEKWTVFKDEWPKVKGAVRRGDYRNRRDYVGELRHQRYLLWLKIEKLT